MGRNSMDLTQGRLTSVSINSKMLEQPTCSVWTDGREVGGSAPTTPPPAIPVALLGPPAGTLSNKHR